MSHICYPHRGTVSLIHLLTQSSFDQLSQRFSVTSAPLAKHAACNALFWWYLWMSVCLPRQTKEQVSVLRVLRFVSLYFNELEGLMDGLSGFLNGHPHYPHVHGYCRALRTCRMRSSGRPENCSGFRLSGRKSRMPWKSWMRKRWHWRNNWARFGSCAWKRMSW